MTIEAMKQALEALDCIYWPLHVREIEKVGKAMAALRAAIEKEELIQRAEEAFAASEQKPVATVKLKIEKRFIRGSDMGLGCSDGYVTNRYLTLEFINYNMNDPEKSCFKDGDVLYTTPPAAPRQWVGLTDEEATQIWDGVIKYAPGEIRVKDFARAIEAKLKEKNT